MDTNNSVFDRNTVNNKLFNHNLVLVFYSRIDCYAMRYGPILHFFKNRICSGFFVASLQPGLMTYERQRPNMFVDIQIKCVETKFILAAAESFQAAIRPTPEAQTDHFSMPCES